jgi:hypothetical protein
MENYTLRRGSVKRAIPRQDRVLISFAAACGCRCELSAVAALNKAYIAEEHS